MGDLYLSARKRKTVADLHYLCSTSAESMDDYSRINLFVRVGADAAALINADLIAARKGK